MSGIKLNAYCRERDQQFPLWHPTYWRLRVHQTLSARLIMTFLLGSDIIKLVGAFITRTGLLYCCPRTFPHKKKYRSSENWLLWSLELNDLVAGKLVWLKL